MDAEGNKMFCERIANDALRLLEVVSQAGDGAEVVIEATYGWYWAVDLLQDAGFNVHLAHPSGNDWGQRRGEEDGRGGRGVAGGGGRGRGGGGGGGAPRGRGGGGGGRCPAR